MNRDVTHKIGREVEFVELVGGLQQAGDQGRHQHLLPQLVDICGPPLAAGHLHRPAVRVGDDAHRLGYGLVQHRVLTEGRGMDGRKGRLGGKNIRKEATEVSLLFQYNSRAWKSQGFILRMT